MKILRGACADCEFTELERVPRKLWMRLLLPPLRHYYCNQCRQNVLARKDLVEVKRWMTSTLKDFSKDTKRHPG